MTEPKQKPGRSKQDYGTPPEFLTAVKAKLEIPFFDCDLAASAENAVAGRYYTEAENSLTQPWTCGRGWNWLNPPFTHIHHWANKANISAQLFGARTAMLIPAAVGANWWRDYVHEQAIVWFLNGRLTFVGCTDPYPKDCALLLYTPVADDFSNWYDVWTWKPSRSAAMGEPVREREDPIVANQARRW